MHLYPIGRRATKLFTATAIYISVQLTSYYPSSIDKDGRGVRIFCRIRPDGSGWEDVSWMFY